MTASEAPAASREHANPTRNECQEQRSDDVSSKNVRRRALSTASLQRCCKGVAAAPAPGPNENSGVERMSSEGTGQPSTMSRRRAAVLSAWPEEERMWHEVAPPRVVLGGAGEEAGLVPFLEAAQLSVRGAAHHDPIDDPEERGARRRRRWFHRGTVRPFGSHWMAARQRPTHEADARWGTERLCRSSPSGAARRCRSMERERGSLRAGMRHSGSSCRA
jgi:hypothetical protein